MPIKDLSDTVRLPRLGKIHLGIRDPQRGFPVKTDYFVLPPEHPSLKELVTAFGEKPKSLRVLIPTEDEELWAPQYYKCYDKSHGLLCKGDGEVAMRMVDMKTGQFPTKEACTTELKEMPCKGKSCPEYISKKCGEKMTLRIVLPEIPGLGIWQIDTGSKNSILNINSCARIIKSQFGRISGIPLSLTLEPIDVNNPETGKKQTVFVLNLRTDVTLAQLAAAARGHDKTFKLAMPDLEVAFEEQVERDIADYWPEGKQKAIEAPQVKQGEAVIPPVASSTVSESDKDFAKLGEERQRIEAETRAKSLIDIDWVDETLRIIKWKESTLTSWIKKHPTMAGVAIDQPKENLLASLNAEQAKVLHDHLFSMREITGK
jgi:hypothetical protein